VSKRTDMAWVVHQNGTVDASAAQAKVGGEIDIPIDNNE
jgi:hypothetical protein